MKPNNNCKPMLQGVILKIFLLTAIVEPCLGCSSRTEEVEDYYGARFGETSCSIDCAGLDSGEHCEEKEGVCKCGNGPTCIGTDRPFCNSGQCKECDKVTHISCVKDEVEICLSKSFECDGEHDCDDGKDEISGNCEVTQCMEHQCMDGGCVDVGNKCNGVEECSDGSDEMFCDEELPAFTVVNCAGAPRQPSYELCYRVNYPNDGSYDHLLLNKMESGIDFIYVGELQNEKGSKVTVITPNDITDNHNSIQIHFHSIHVGTCVHFDVEVTRMKTECIKYDSSLLDSDKQVAEMQGQTTSQKFHQAAKRNLDPNGYELDVVVYYDDMFHSEFGTKAVGTIKTIMAIANQKWSEKDTLTTRVQINTREILHAKGHNWGRITWSGDMMNRKLGPIARQSQHEAHLYVFMTGKGSRSGNGLAWVGTVCDHSKQKRLNLNKYASSRSKDSLTYTSEVVAHEIAHNLGINHDCKGPNFNCAHWGRSYKGPREHNGQKCFGYMDYRDNTPGWSTCSVNDFTGYLNRVRDFCLKTISDGGDGRNQVLSTCPKTHPYAYLNGELCCHSSQTCQGNPLKINSNCCQDSAYKHCPGTKCKTNADATTGKSVSCGSHRAPSCTQCTLGQVPLWCGGDCKWDTDVNTCVKRGSVSRACEDKGAHCIYWAGKDYCTGKHQKYMRTYCMESCRLC